MKKNHFFISYLLLLIVGVLFVSCSGNDPKEPKDVVVTPENDTTFQYVTNWDTIRTPKLRISQYRWYLSDGVDTLGEEYFFDVCPFGVYYDPTEVEYDGGTMIAYAPYREYSILVNPISKETGDIIQYYYYSSTTPSERTGKIYVRKGNICSMNESYAVDEEDRIHVIRQCTVRITPSENGQDLFECRMSVVGWDNKLMYHYIVGPIDYNPLWER